MMRAPVVALFALVVLALPEVVRGDTIGPLCWNMIVPADGAGEPSVASFALLFHVAAGSPASATVAGLGVFGPPHFPTPVSGAAVQTSEAASMALTVAPTPTRGPLFLNIAFTLSTLVGGGRCTGGTELCGEGKDVSWEPCVVVE